MTKNDVNRRVVMVDLDGVNPRWQKVEPFLIRFKWVLARLWPSTVKWKIDWKKSPSGSGVHLWAIADEDIVFPDAMLPTISKYKVLLAQCLAGSDIARERANLSRIAAGVKDWNRLFSTRRQGVFTGRRKKKARP